MRYLSTFLSVLIVTHVVMTKVHAQMTEISQDEFAKVVNKTLDVIETVPTRSTLEHRTVLFGKVQREVTQVVEYIGFDKMRRKEIFRDNGVLTKTNELIEVNGSYYCRTDGGRWKRETDDCNPMFISLSPPEDALLKKFTVTETMLDGRKVKLYHHHRTFKRQFMHAFDHKVWLDNDGYRIKVESRNGLADDHEHYQFETETYQYRPKGLVIVAPKLGVRK